MLIIRIVVFFLMVLIVSTYVTHEMSVVFLKSALEAKNDLIAEQKATIKNLVETNIDKDIIIENSKEVIKNGIKNGCIKYSEAEN